MSNLTPPVEERLDAIEKRLDKNQERTKTLNDIVESVLNERRPS